MIRNLFLREEGDRLFIATGIFPEWLAKNASITFGPGPTSFGDVSVSVMPGEQQIEVRWEGTWRKKPKEIVVHLPGYASVTQGPDDSSVVISRESSL